jgi:hypothetical protein
MSSLTELAGLGGLILGEASDDEPEDTEDADEPEDSGPASGTD